MAQVWTDHDRVDPLFGEDHGPFRYEQNVPETGRISNGGPTGPAGGGIVAGTAHRLVKRELYPIHIFLIIISGTIGMGLFVNSGELLSIAGPVGGLIAYLIVGFCVICIMEGIAEMIGHWPIGNAFVEFVKAFVDKDLAIVVGLAYWYAYAISFATLIIAAANLATYWQWGVTLQDFVFIGGVPILLLIINCCGVFWYGNVEAVMGALKIILVIGSFILMIVINHEDTHAPTPNGEIQSIYINQGFQHNPVVAPNDVVAVLTAIPIIAYAYIGVEIVAVTALEANKPQKSLKYPAMSIGWVTATIYFLSALSFYLNVSWTDPLLPSVAGRVAHGTLTIAPSTNTTQSGAIAVIAVINAGKTFFPGFLNACFIMAVLSASNTALYVASRTLFGLTRDIDQNDRYWGWLSKLSTTTHNRKIPAAALLTSAVAFCWVPFLHLTKSYTDQDLQEIMSGIATVGVVVVWGAQCLAFIRYRMWLRRFKAAPQLVDDYPEYNHWLPNNKALPFTTILAWSQPAPAVIGLMFCILTVFVFATASWWSKKESRTEIYSAFVGPVVLLASWLLLKFRRWLRDDLEWYVKLGSWEQLQDRLDRLTSAVVTDVPVTTTNRANGAVFELEPVRTSTNPEGMYSVRDSGYVTPRAGDVRGMSVGMGMGGAGGLGMGMVGGNEMAAREEFFGEMHGSRSPSPMDVGAGTGWGGRDSPGRHRRSPSPNPSPRTNCAELDRGERRLSELAGSPAPITRRPVGQPSRERMVVGGDFEDGNSGSFRSAEMERQGSGERGGTSRGVGRRTGRGRGTAAGGNLYDARLEPGAWAGSGGSGRGGSSYI